MEAWTHIRFATGSLHLKEAEAFLVYAEASRERRYLRCKLPYETLQTMTEAELAKLSQAMDWVIPPDKTPGAGSAVCVQRMVELIESEPPDVLLTFQRELPHLQESDLADLNHRFAQLLIEMVRDVYYGYPENGSWADIGFKVTDP